MNNEYNDGTSLDVHHTSLTGGMGISDYNHIANMMSCVEFKRNKRLNNNHYNLREGRS